MTIRKLKLNHSVRFKDSNLPPAARMKIKLDNAKLFKDVFAKLDEEAKLLQRDAVFHNKKLGIYLTAWWSLEKEEIDEDKEIHTF